jgi:hypothetical protein
MNRVSLGSVEGRLEMISADSRMRFILYQSTTNVAVTCLFSSEKLMEEGRIALGERVIAGGAVFSNAGGEPVRIEVESLRRFQPEQQLPTAAELFGADPDFTGEMSTDEYIRQIRAAEPIARESGFGSNPCICNILPDSGI